MRRMCLFRPENSLHFFCHTHLRMRRCWYGFEVRLCSFSHFSHKNHEPWAASHFPSMTSVLIYLPMWQSWMAWSHIQGSIRRARRMRRGQGARAPSPTTQEFPQAQGRMLPCLISKTTWGKHRLLFYHNVAIGHCSRLSERHSIGVTSASEASGLISFRQLERSAVSASQVKHPVTLSQLPADSFWAGRDERRHLQPSALSSHPTTAQPRSHQRGRNCISHSSEREREGETSSVTGGCTDCEALYAAVCVRQEACFFFFFSCPAFCSL